MAFSGKRTLDRAARARAEAARLRGAAQLERDDRERDRLVADAELLERAAQALEDSGARLRELDALEVTLADRRARFTKR